MDYIEHLAILVSIFATLAVSLDLLIGQMGLLSVTQAAFFGIGAYTSAILALKFGAPFGVGLAAAMGLAAVISLAASIPSWRLHEDYFAIATIGLQIILFSVANNWETLTGGPLGIFGIPQPSIFGNVIASEAGFLVLAILVAVAAHFVVYLITSSPFGRVLRAIREDELFAMAQGKNTRYFKVVTFAVSAALAASAGSLYAQYISYVDPTSFTIMESILIASMVIIGGAGSRWGPLVGASIVTLLPEGLRFIGLPTAVAANLRLALYGSLLVILMMVRPQGLLGHYRFRR